MSSTSEPDSVLHQILSFMESVNEKDSEVFISRSRVKDWMTEGGIETLGALTIVLLEPKYYKRIQPLLTLEDYHPFIMSYFERCIRENPDGEWADSRYSAGWSLANWFQGLWDDPNVPRGKLSELKKWLGLMYLSGDDALRNCIVNATLEHLFQNKDVASFFKDWSNNSELMTAYKMALEFSSSESNGGVT